MVTETLHQPSGESTSEQSVIDVFRHCVLTAPDRTATVHEASEMTYGELHNYAARIATQLQKLQLQSEQTVGLCLDRSHHAIAAMLGSWLADGAFVPLDPDYPDERLRYMVEDAQVQVIVSSTQYAPLFADSGIELLLLDDSSPQSLPEPELNLLHAPAASQLAYIMYTSGSTGMPKGVPIEHGALLNYCHADAEVYQLTATDRTLQFSTINFDIAIEEIFPPLITGGAVVIRPLERIEAQIELSALVEQYGITAIHLATGYWHEWVDLMVAAEAQAPATIRLMVVTGEKVSAAHYHRWREIEAQPALWANAYGPTETTVTATVFVPPAGWDDENLPIGKAIKGYTAHILTDQHQPIAHGETGELYIGGDSLARGYLNRPDLTEKAFVEIEMDSGTSERLYRTGDLARWLPSGDIAYAGRIDHQLKIGSYRVEPGEIEAALNQYDSVLESLVVADQSGNQKALLAYLACDIKRLDLTEIYGWLQQKLPPHMVPLKYILLENFPKTINGKIDRKKLPDPNTAVTATQTNFEAPQTETEVQLAKVWQNQLSLAKVGRQDNFFGLGGDSLLVTRTLGAMQREMQVTLTVREFFANPELHQLAACIDAGQGQQHTDQYLHSAQTLPQIPLTANQLRIWQQCKSSALSPSMFQVHEAVRLSRKLDASRLVATLKEVIARHSALQMQVLQQDGKPAMCWLPDFELCVQQDVLAADDSLIQYTERCLKSQSFDLSTGPLVRAHLASGENGEYLLVLVSHHIVADSWYMSVLLREIAADYTEHARPDAPWQIVEFAQADSALRIAGAFDSQLDYWATQLDSLEPVEFNQDHKTPVSRQFSAQQIDFDLSADLPSRLESTARQLNCSAHDLLMTCYFALLHRHTRCEDIAISTVVHSRHDAHLGATVGTLADSVPIRTQVTAKQSFVNLLHSVSDTTRDAISNSDVYFEEIVHKVNPTRVVDQLPFSPFVFLLQSIPDSKLQLESLDHGHLVAPITSCEYDLLLEISAIECDGAPAYSARLVYSDELFERSSIERLVVQYQRLLEQALQQPETLIHQLELLSDADKHALVYELNPPATPFDESLSFIDRIWLQSQKNPEKIAVSDDAGNALSYRELTDRAQELAVHLQTLGAGPGVLVALSMHRSADMLIAVLGIMRSGSAYLPMDPTYPAERVKYILEDAKAPVLVTQQSLRDSLPTSGATVFCLDCDWPLVEATTKDGAILDQARIPSLSDLAYVIYTSGSTGNPKGVQLTHRNVLNFLLSMQKTPGLNADDKLLAVTTLSFDISLLELYLPLITGAELIVASRELVTDSKALAQFIEAEQITLFQATPTTWRMLLEADWQGNGRVKGIIGGEPLPPDMLPRMLSMLGSLWNMYGPTETTVYSTGQRMIDPLGSISIGKPVDNTQVYILDDQQQLCPRGTPGELCIAGDGVSLGYTNRSDLNASQFLPNPYSDKPDARIYRTGDLARWREDGNLSYIGRMDNLVKLNGYRIELGEIEAVLARHENIKQAAVVIREDSPGIKRLVAYWVAEQGMAGGDHHDFHQLLGKHLPSYMVPQQYMQLDAMPQTPNGKLDRKALPKPAARSTALSEDQIPQTETEAKLAKVWQSQLSLENVGRLDNFFGLGGDSLLVARTLGAIQKEMQTALTAREFFANPALHQLAACIDAGQNQQHLLQLQRIAQPLPKVPLAASQLRFWLQYESTALSPSMFHVHEAVRLSSELDDKRLVTTLKAVVARHSALQMQVLLQDGNPTMCWQPDFELPVQRDVLTADDSEIQYVEDCVNKQRFDLTTGPLVRAHLACTDSGDFLLVLVAHHMVADGWSMTVLQREIAAHYAGHALPDEPWQFIEFAQADSTLRAAGAFDSQLDYWAKQLDALEPVEFNQDHKTPVARRFSAQQVDFDLSTSLTARLESTARQFNSSAHALLMACYFALLHRHTRCEDIAIATAVHGRNDALLDDIVGNFVGTVPVRAQITAKQSFVDLLHSVRDTTRDAISNSDAHFDEIVRRVNPTRVGDQLPFTPFMFLFQNIPDSELQLEGIDCEHLVSPIRSSEYDILLEITAVENDGAPAYSARFAYSDELFERSSIERFVVQFQRLLEQALQQPETPIHQLELLTDTDKQALVYGLNPPATPLDESLNFVEHIWQQAQQNPDKTAVRDDAGHALSYGELCRQSDQLAVHLQTLGAGPGVLIALSMHRSANMLIALLGIMRSGSAYLPMDPTYPAERVRYILGDAQAPVLITQSNLKDSLPQSDATVLCLDSDWSNIVATSDNGAALDQARAPSLSDLAYVIYTSGSTGNPKGVQLTHRNVLNFLLSMQKTPGLSANDKLLAVTTLSFDIAVLELYLPLITGAELIVASRELAIDGKKLALFLESNRVSVLQATPATWRLLLEAEWAGDGRIKGLVGGEALPADMLPHLLPKLSTLWNMYGPTETTVWSTCQQITEPLASISIGKPIANTQVYILDDQQQLCPQGTPGELCIAGDGVSLGYTNRADLNASQFLADPYSDKPDARLYRTGDLARWREDGSLSYISRLDNLVKLNGYRIELGEIEAVLANHVDVKQTAVVIREDTPGAKRLVAYWVADASASTAITDQSFLQHLGNSLPSYMIPQQYVQLEAMPQTPNGKLDRKALPEPPKRSASEHSGSLDNAIQREIADQWQHLLGVESLGSNDNFFRLGGHSLSAVKFINWAESKYNVNIPLRILVMGTLGQIAVQIDPSTATAIDMSQVSSDGLPEMSIELIDNGDVQLFCTHIHSGKPSSKALLVLSSHGYEQSRLDRTYRSLSLELAKQNVHSMRVDLAGMGNSSLDSIDIKSLEQWRSDIRRASEALLKSSGCESVSVLAARFTASLLNAETFDGIALDQAFLWDPVVHGEQWWQQRVDLQSQVTSSGYYYLKPRIKADPQGLHTPGFNINTDLRAVIGDFKLDTTKLDARFHVICAADADATEFGSAQLIRTRDELDWSDTHASTSTDIASHGMSKHVLQTLTGQEL